MKNILKWKNGELKTQFFLPDTVNIFTDASVCTDLDRGCLGVALVYTNENYEDLVLTRPATTLSGIPDSYQAEQAAAYLGICRLVTAINDKKIPLAKANLFTDSIAVVQSVRKKMRYLKRIGVDSKEYKYLVKNVVHDGEVDWITCIADFCISYNISIYHVKGHIKKVKDMRKKFVQHNGFVISKYDAYQFLKYNHLVDGDANTSVHCDIENTMIHSYYDNSLISDEPDNNVDQLMHGEESTVAYRTRE